MHLPAMVTCKKSPEEKQQQSKYLNHQRIIQESTMRELSTQVPTLLAPWSEMRLWLPKKKKLVAPSQSTLPWTRTLQPPSHPLHSCTPNHHMLPAFWEPMLTTTNLNSFATYVLTSKMKQTPTTWIWKDEFF